MEDIQAIVSQEEWYMHGLSIIVVGASGDLAKKKTYPSLFDLFVANLLPKSTIIWGYARTLQTHQQLRDQLRPYIISSQHNTNNTHLIDSFLSKCYYQSGKSYGDLQAWKELITIMDQDNDNAGELQNRMFYFAIPPTVFGETSMAIHQTMMDSSSRGWSRLVIEKPFGRDLSSCDVLSNTLANHFDEHQLYRIDHYLGKEVVQNILIWRFSNIFEHTWNCQYIHSVVISFQETFGTDGRGGYFDSFGIIRDVMQNHLLQILMLLAMEEPTSTTGESIRDAKLKVLEAMVPMTLENCLLGQYEGYSDDSTIENKDTNCPTYAALRTFIYTPRWSGVPFVLEAGKAMTERKCEIRIQFRAQTNRSPPNELVMRLQPNPALYFQANIKSPGFASNISPVQFGMDYTRTGTNNCNNPDAYTRLILDVLRGRQESFVRNDELRKSWEIFTPLLHTIENDNVRPILYAYGTNGPMERDAFFQKMGIGSRHQYEELPKQAKM